MRKRGLFFRLSKVIYKLQIPAVFAQFWSLLEVSTLREYRKGKPQMHPRERVYGMVELLRSKNQELPQALIDEAQKLGIPLEQETPTPTKPNTKETTDEQ